MDQIKKITRINLGILLLYSIIIQFATQVSQLDNGYTGLSILIFTLWALVPHIGINVIASIYAAFTKKEELSRAFLFSSLILLIVGFSSCWGNAMLGESF